VSLAAWLASVGDASGFRFLQEACRSPDLHECSLCGFMLGSFRKAAIRDQKFLADFVELALVLAEGADPEIAKDALNLLDALIYDAELPFWVIARLETLSALSSIPEVRSIADRTIEHQNAPPNRIFEIYRLGRRGNLSNLPWLKILAERDPDPRARREATLALVRLGERSYLGAAHKFMEESPKRDDQITLAGELAELGDGSGLHYVEAACRAREVRERVHCCFAMEKFIAVAKQDTRVISAVSLPLLDLAGDPEAQVRASAISALRNFSREMLLPQPVINRLEKLGKSTLYPEVREMAQAVLAEQKQRTHQEKDQKP